MKPLKESKIKFIYGSLSTALGGALSITLVWVVLLLIFLIKGTPMPTFDGFPVRLLIANNHILANQAKDIYLMELSGKLMFINPSIWLQLYSGFYTIIIFACASYIIYLTWTSQNQRGKKRLSLHKKDKRWNC